MALAVLTLILIGGGSKLLLDRYPYAPKLAAVKLRYMVKRAMRKMRKGITRSSADQHRRRQIHAHAQQPGMSPPPPPPETCDLPTAPDAVLLPTPWQDPVSHPALMPTPEPTLSDWATPPLAVARELTFDITGEEKLESDEEEAAFAERDSDTETEDEDEEAHCPDCVDVPGLFAGEEEVGTNETQLD
jgi:hypothetical protein